MQKKIEKIALQNFDKVLHFIAGYFMFVFAACFVCNWFALGLVALAAMLKEWFDTLKNEPTGWSWLDFLFTVLGALPALLIAFK